MSKGSTRRPTAVPPAKVADNWEQTFGAKPRTLFGFPVLVDPSLPTPPGEIVFGVVRTHLTREEPQ